MAEIGKLPLRVDQPRGQDLPRWFMPTLQAMEALPWQTDDWTSGGKRTQADAIVGVLSILAKVLDNRALPPSVVPTWSGGVQVEWHVNNVDLEIEAGPQGEIEYFFKSPDEEREGKARDDLDQLAKYAQAVSTSE